MPKDTTKEVTLTIGKECKQSVRYETTDPSAVITNVYLNRTFAETMPKSIKLVIAEA